MTKEELENEIRNADKLYYTSGTSPYSDRQYDNMKEALAEMDPSNPLLSSLGQDHVEGYRKVKHECRMLSLDKVHEIDMEDKEQTTLFDSQSKLFPWLFNLPGVDKASLEAAAKDTTDMGTALAEAFSASRLKCVISVEPKVDGMSAEALYVKGCLRHISTRGNGEEGDDITANVKHLFPEKIKIGNDSALSEKFVIRGELYISKDEFLRINAEQEKAGLQTFANPRNLCTGAVRCQEGLMGRNISFVIHDYVDLTNTDHVTARFKSTTAHICELTQYGLDSILNYADYPEMSLMDIFAAVTSIGEKRDQYPFIIDGAVIKICDIALRKQLGETDHHPRWAMAFKYLPERKETILKKVTWQLGGKTGKCTPVGEIEPVIIAGTVVSRASLGNAGLMAHRGIWEGCRVLVEKSGEIIPYVRKVLDPKIVILPEMMLCPSCGAEMHLEKGKTAHTANYVCTNPVCKDKLKAALCSAFGSSGLNVIGFGPETADAFIEGWEENASIPNNAQVAVLDLVWLDKEMYPKSLAGKIGDNVFGEMERIRTAPLHRWIAGLQVEGLAMGSAKKVAQKFKDFKAVIAALDTPELLECLTKKASLPNLKEAISTALDFLEMREISDFNPVSEHYIDKEWSDTTSKLGGKNFVVTGKFHTGRTVIENMVVANGGNLKSSVSKQTDYLVAGEAVGATTKINKAAACGTKVITEEEFLQMCQ